MTAQTDSPLYHIAQINIARLRHDRDDPRMADFFDNLDRINALAERSPGFVWRLMEDTGIVIQVDAVDGSVVITNMSLWQSVETLQQFAYKTVHNRFIRRRAEWFRPTGGPSLTLWWVKAGQVPGVEEGRKRLEHLAQKGPSPTAFTFSSPCDPPDLRPRQK